MTEPVIWREDGMPVSVRFGDVYHSAAGALAQAKHVFLQGCGLPQAWAGHAGHTICETGFGLGLNFLASWAAWESDPERCTRLHYVSVEAWPVSAQDIRRASAGEPSLAGLGEQLACAYEQELAGTSAGLHRISLAQGRVLLTLCVGDALAMLRQCSGVIDSVFLDGFSPTRNPQMWEPQLFKALARLCRPGTQAASWTVASPVRKALGEAGFTVSTLPGLPPKRDCLSARYEPRWPVSVRAAPARRHAIVIGAGLAGAAAASSLVRRGWLVDVVCSGHAPADGASGLPVGLLAAHQTASQTAGQTALSRLSEAGVRMTLHELWRLLPAGDDWQPTVIDTFEDGVVASTQQGAQVRPAALVQAWLDEGMGSGRLRLHMGTTVSRLERVDDSSEPSPSARWRAVDDTGQCAATAPVCVVAGAHASATLQALPQAIRSALLPVKGQFSLGPLTGEPDAPRPRRGDGVYVPRFMLDGEACWGAGATYERAMTDRDVTQAAHLSNLAGLQRLCPPAGARFRAQLETTQPDMQARGFSAVRCASPDRLPLIGPVPDESQVRAATQAGALPGLPGLHMLAALGSRGLSLAALAGELLAARIEGEPWPVERSLGLALDPGRWVLRARRKEASAS